MSNPYLAANWECNECGVHDGHDRECSRLSTHEFVEGSDPRHCRHCGGYPFDLLHWTI